MNLFNHQKLAQLFSKLEADQPFAIAVSGGGDSMALLHLALNWQGGPHNIRVLTVDHALRETSAAEARRVKRWCADLGVEHHTLKWRHDEITTGIQAKARAARYELMAAWCRKHGIACLLTAHTIEDQAETVAMRKLRTQSARSLAAIWPEVEQDGLRIIRPLLGEQRQDLRHYLQAQHQSWIEDDSNANPRFERVRIRKATPAEAAAPLAREASEAQSQVLQSEVAAHKWCATNLEIAPHGMMTFAPDKFAALKPEVADAVLRRIITLAGGKWPEAEKRASLCDWLRGGALQRRTLGGAVFARRKHAVLTAREPARIDATPITLSGRKSIVWDNRFEVTGPKGSTITCASALKQLKLSPEIPAFVRAGWPLVMRGETLLATPLAQFHKAAKITFIKK